jgi:hypothetical protein
MLAIFHFHEQGTTQLSHLKRKTVRVLNTLQLSHLIAKLVKLRAEAMEERNWGKLDIYMQLRKTKRVMAETTSSFIIHHHLFSKHRFSSSFSTIILLLKATV